MYEEPEGRGGCGPPGCVLVLGVLAALVAVLVARPVLWDGSGRVESSPTRALPRPTSTTHSKMRPGVVIIVTERGFRGTMAAGTGILLDKSGTVLTNNHVIQGATKIRGTVVGRDREYGARVLGYDVAGDVAVIRLRGARGLKPAEFADSDGVLVGDLVTAVGNTGGRAGELDRDPRVVTGKVTGVGQQIVATDESDGSTERLAAMIETNAPIKPGDSGGPLLNADGEVIGMNTAASAGFTLKTQGSGHRGYAIPANRAMRVARQIRARRPSETVHIGPTALLGVTVRSVPAASRGRARAPATAGAFIEDLLPGTPAEAAGLRPGTTIVTLDRHPIDSPGTLTTRLLQYHPDDTVRIGWVDAAGRRFVTPVKLGEGPPQ